MPTRLENRRRLVGVLAVIDGHPRDALLAIYEGENLIGSACSNDLVVDAPGIAPTHARLVHEDGVFALLAVEGDDTAAFVNAEPIDACELGDGDVVRLGSTVFRFRTLPPL